MAFLLLQKPYPLTSACSLTKLQMYRTITLFIIHLFIQSGSTNGIRYSRPYVKSGAKQWTNWSYRSVLSRTGTLLIALLSALPSLMKTWVYPTWFLLRSTCYQKSSPTLSLRFPSTVLFYHWRHISAIAIITLILASYLLTWSSFYTC